MNKALMANALPSDSSKDDYLRLREIESDTQGGHHYKHLRRVRLCSKPCNPTHDAVRLGEKERNENVLNPFSISLPYNSIHLTDISHMWSQMVALKTM